MDFWVKREVEDWILKPAGSVSNYILFRETVGSFQEWLGMSIGTYAAYESNCEDWSDAFLGNETPEAWQEPYRSHWYSTAYSVNMDASSTCSAANRLAILGNPRPVAKEKASGKSGPGLGKGKGKDQSGGKGKDKYPIPPPEQPPWLLPTSTSSTPSLPSTATYAEQQLAHWAQVMRKQEQHLPAEVQALLQEQSWQEGNASTKTMHQAVTKFGQARKNLQAARIARTQFHHTWRRYLSDSIERWQGYLNYFETQDKALENEINKAYDLFKESRGSLDRVKSEVAEKDGATIEILSDDDMTEKGEPPQALLRQDLSSAVETFRQLKAKADAALDPIPKRQKLEGRPEGVEDGGTHPTLPGPPPGLADEHPLITKWSHSILAEEFAISEWSAIDSALELQWEVHGTWMQPSKPEIIEPARRRSKSRSVNFATHDTVYVGSECTLAMVEFQVPSPSVPQLRIGQWHMDGDRGQAMDPTRDAAFPEDLCFHMHSSPQLIDPYEAPEDTDDETSLLAHQAIPFHQLPREPVPVQPQPGEHNLQEVHPGDYDDPQENHGAEGEEEEPEVGSTDSESMRDQRQWQSVHIFQIGASVTETRTRWDNYESLLRDVARATRHRSRDIMTIYEVIHGPRDLEEADIAALLLHKSGDLSPGEQRKYVLLDVQFHNPAPSSHYEVNRMIKLLPPWTSRQAILRFLELETYCRQTRHRCLMWHNHDLVPLQGNAIIHFKHGDYLRIAVPPKEDECEVPTHHAAYFANSGISRQLQTKRWRDGSWDSEIDQVPTHRLRMGNDHTGQESMAADHLQLLQTEALVHFPPSRQNSPIQCKIEDNHTVDHWEPAQADVWTGELVEQPTPEDMPLRHRRPADMDLDPMNIDEVQTHQAEEPTGTYWITWFLNGFNHLTCTQPRNVRVSPDPAEWTETFRRAWIDLLDPTMDIEWYVVQPEPPPIILEPVLGHILVTQQIHSDQRCYHATRIFEGFPHMIAFVGRPTITRMDLICATHDQVQCYRHQLEFVCRVTADQVDIWDDTQHPGLHGLGCQIHIMRRIRPLDTSEDVDIALGPSVLWPPEELSRTGEGLRDLWKALAPHMRQEGLPLRTWFIHHQHQLRGGPSRLAWLGPDPSSWAQDIAQVWRDHIHAGYPIFIHMVRPQPRADGYFPQVFFHAIVSQGDLFQPDRAGILITSSFDTQVEHTVVSAFNQPTAENIIFYAKAFDKCSPARDGWACEVLFDHYTLTPGRRTQVDHGYNFVVQGTRRQPEQEASIPHTSQEENRVDDATSHLQVPLNTRRKLVLEHLLRDETIEENNAANAIPRGPGNTQIWYLLDLTEDSLLPPFLEVPVGSSPEEAKTELDTWGFSGIALPLHKWPIIACVDNTIPDEIYIYCPIETWDRAHVFSRKHCSRFPLTEVDHMRFLYGKEQTRAAIITAYTLLHRVQIVLYHNNIPQVDMPKNKNSEKVNSWPAPMTCREDHPFYLGTAAGSAPAEQLLQLPFDIGELERFFTSADGILQQVLPGLPMDQTWAQQLQALPIHHHQDQFDCFDRLLIYTDGSSKPVDRHKAPNWNEDQGAVDSWSFVVAGEKYATQELFLIGWHTQPVIFDQDHKYWAGAEVMGSLTAEQEALLWAGLWRIAHNSRIPTTFGIDNSIAQNQAEGLMGAQTNPTVYKSLRGVFQTLEHALGPDALQLHHVYSHQGDVLNEFADWIAGLERERSLHCPRQQIDMRTWKLALPHVWMFTHRHPDMPKLYADGLHVPAPDLPALSSQQIVRIAETAKQETQWTIHLRCASANVNSLYTGPTGHAGKIQFLKAQMLSHELVLLGLQETRSAEAFSTANGIIRIASGSERGNYGVELWIATTLQGPTNTQAPGSFRLWMHAQLHHASDLLEPDQHWEQWQELLLHSPNYWKRLVNRAVEHHVGQHRNAFRVLQFHELTFNILKDYGFNCPDISPTSPEPRPQAHFGCMACRARFKTAAGEGAHMCKSHRLPSQLRFLYDGTACRACLKEYHTHDKLQAHLRYSTHCRELLQGQRHRCQPVPGIGSKLNDDLQRQHGGLRPVQQGLGPLPMQRPPQPDSKTDHDLLAILQSELLDQRLEFFKVDFLLDICERHPTSWTTWRATITELYNQLGPEEAELLELDLDDLRDRLHQLQDPTTWPFLQTELTGPVDSTGIWDYEAVFADIATRRQGLHPPAPLPRNFSRERYVLHAFAGRRRFGDFQFYLDAMTKRGEGTLTFVLSIDIIIDEDKGNLMKASSQAFWLQAMKQRFIIGFIGGPPCNTWSQARFQDLHQPKGKRAPRPVRAPDAPWGLTSLRLGELASIEAGNCLLGFSIASMYTMVATGGCGVLEHPGDPNPSETTEKPTIWRLPIMASILRHPSAQLHWILQGFFGSEGPKPTGLLTINMDDLQTFMEQWKITQTLPHGATTGKDGTGAFNTARLKEYAPAMCSALAQSFFQALLLVPEDESLSVSKEFQDQAAQFISSQRGDTIDRPSITNHTKPLGISLELEDMKAKCDDPRSGLLRFMCGHTCGCSWPYSNPWYRVASHGCSQQCIRDMEEDTLQMACEEPQFWDHYRAVVNALAGEVPQRVEERVQNLTREGCAGFLHVGWGEDMILNGLFCEGSHIFYRGLANLCPISCGCAVAVPWWSVTGA
eukprot:Skav212430  [mRNA]  locus=scaffold1479:62722:91309:+ [translate_table: standard]